MLKTHLIIAFRNLLKRKVYAFVSIFGLALGVAASLLIWQYVMFESSYDEFHQNGNRIYRALFTSYENGEKVEASARFGYGLGPALQEDLPEVKSYVRTHGLGGDQAVISYSNASGEDHRFQEENVLFVDSTFFSVFTSDVLHGDGPSSLNNPSSIVLTASSARRYFGEGVNPVGKIMHVFTQDWVRGDYEVTAVIRDYPANSHLNFEFLIPIHNLLQAENYRQPKANWNWVNFITYVEIFPNVAVESMNAKTDALLTKYTGPNEPGTFIFTFQPLHEIHLADREGNALSSLTLYVGVAFSILVLAWINYINISTAHATERAKEVGVKKAMGVFRAQLVNQFLVESLVINFLSVVLAVALALSTLPLLEWIIGKDISLNLSQTTVWFVLLLIFVIGSLASGIYPAFVLSSYKTIDVIKGFGAGKSSLSLRHALVIFQFTVSLLFLAATYTAYRQINFMQQHEKGMTVSQMLVVDGPKIIDDNNAEERIISFKHDVGNFASVENVTSSANIPGRGFSWVTGMTRLGAVAKPTQIETIYVIFHDYDFPETYGIELQTGRLPDRNLASDERAVLINEAALIPFELGNAAQALDAKLILDKSDTVTVVGVFKNVHWNSLHTAHVPMLLWPEKISPKQFSIRLSGNFESSIAQIEKRYNKYFPGNPFHYYFLDDFIDQQYKEDRQFEKILSLFAFLAITIACLGLAGLGAFTTAQRSKEITIRKIFGASVTNILSLLTVHFLKLLIIAILISLPIAWYAADSWLNNFAFRIQFSADLFIIPSLLLVVLACLTISVQVFKGANTNPAKVLRNE
jgi:putative ABC transport system permease protein